MFIRFRFTRLDAFVPDNDFVCGVADDDENLTLLKLLAISSSFYPCNIFAIKS